MLCIFIPRIEIESCLIKEIIRKIRKPHFDLFYEISKLSINTLVDPMKNRNLQNQELVLTYVTQFPLLNSKNNTIKLSHYQKNKNFMTLSPKNFSSRYPKLLQYPTKNQESVLKFPELCLQTENIVGKPKNILRTQKN